jgi:hypothetical protein
MEPLLDPAAPSPEERDAMSAQRPPDPLGDRPRMAEALASLKEGLRDTADPLYDGWKRRPRAAQAEASPEGGPVTEKLLAPAAAPIVPRFKLDAAEDPGLTIDLSRHVTPEETPIGDLEVTIDEDFGDTLATANLSTEEAFFAEGQTNEMASAPPVVRHSSVQADTVRVRVIRYPSFPRWALIVAAALVVFALSILALRPTLLGDREEVLAESDVTVTDEVEAPMAAGMGPEIAPAIAPLVPLAPTSSASPSAVATEKDDLSPPLFVGGTPPVRPAMGRPTVAPVGSAVQGKIPAATRRRSGSRDFFRDPGF